MRTYKIVYIYTAWHIAKVLTRYHLFPYNFSAILRIALIAALLRA